VASDIQLPGATLELPGPGPDLVIRAGPVPDALEAPTAEAPTWQTDGRRVRLQIPDIGRFLVCGREIRYRADGNAGAVDVAAFVGGPLLALCVSLRNRAVIRASAVCAGGNAVLFCGPSGAGKSTLAAALVARGHPLLVDDVCAVTIAPAPLAHPDTTSLKLWLQAIDRLRLGPAKVAPVRPCLEKHYVAPEAWASEPAAIGVVYHLRESRPPHASGIEALNVVDATVAFARTAYHPAMVEPLRARDLYFQVGAAVAGAAPVFHLTRPMTFDALYETADQLERHWAQIGLQERAA